MKGIVLAGGHGSRLFPLTSIVTKQLQPVYDKPMIYYPISLLMLCGIKEILLISTPKDLPLFKEHLGNGERFGINLQYQVQDAPKGIPQAFTLGRDFIGNDEVTLILGDNIFYGNFDVFRNAINNQNTHLNNYFARIFAYEVNDPERYGIVEFEKSTKQIKSIEEKPLHPKSNYAIPGLYMFDNSVIQRSLDLQPSARGELEITDLIKSYFTEEKLGIEVINRGMAWFDTGTPQSLLEASQFIGAIEQRQGLKIGCLEEVGLRADFIDMAQFQEVIKNTPNGTYKNYLNNILSEFNA